MESPVRLDLVLRVGEEHASHAVETLAQAFLLESATNYFFPPEEGSKIEKLRALFGWAVEYRLKLGIPILGAFEQNSLEEGAVLVGAATLKVPKMPDDMGFAEELWGSMERVFGAAAIERFGHYEEAQKKHLFERPHHYLVAIGVRPEFQGKGYGGALLRAAIKMSEGDPDSAGIGLDTGSEENQALYERFGFEVVGKEQLGDKTARFMFRPNTL